MKAIYLTRWLLPIPAIGAMAGGCDRPGENAREFVPARGQDDHADDKKGVYLVDASNDLTALNQKIDEFAGKAAVASEAFKTNAQPKIQELRNQRAALEEKLDALGRATGADWNDKKSNYIKAYNEAKTSCQRAWQWLAGKSEL